MLMAVKIRMLIADDRTIMREGLKRLLAEAGDLDTTAEAGSGSEAIDRAGDVDVVLMEMSLPGICGEDLIMRLRNRHPALGILALSSCDNSQVALRALRSGASGYVSKACDVETLIAAIRKVAKGCRFLDPAISEQVALEASGGGFHRRHECLSNREYQILRLLAQGRSVNEIAAQLVINSRTVSTHKARMMEKMGFPSTAELVRYAVAQGLVD